MDLYYDDDYYKYYYLLYKLKSSKIYWIVEESVDSTDLIDLVKNFKSKQENYYVVSKEYPVNIFNKILKLPFKRFRKFEVDAKSHMIYKTK